MKKIMLLSVILVLAFATFFVSSLNSIDRFGTLDYTDAGNSTYYFTYSFYLNQTEQTITFIGANESNALHAAIFPFNDSNEFNARINYVWYNGWFDKANLYVNEYAPSSSFYVSNISTDGNQTYFAQFLIDYLPYYNISNATVNVAFNNWTGESTIESSEYPFLNSSAPLTLINDTLTAGHVYLPILLETRLVQAEGQEMVGQLQFNAKTDFGLNGLNPRFVSTLYPILPVESLNITLLNPTNGQVFQTESGNAQVGFEFLANSTYNSSTPNCLVNVKGNSNNFTLASSIDEATSIGTATLGLEPGNYNWEVTCEIEKTTWSSTNSSFQVVQVLPQSTSSGPIRLRVEEEGGSRRRSTITLPIEDLSQSQEEPANNQGIISLITGAVTGTIGKTGGIGLGILLIVVGLVALVIYNREHLGFVKKE